MAGRWTDDEMAAILVSINEVYASGKQKVDDIIDRIKFTNVVLREFRCGLSLRWENNQIVGKIVDQSCAEASVDTPQSPKSPVTTARDQTPSSTQASPFTTAPDQGPKSPVTTTRDQTPSSTQASPFTTAPAQSTSSTQSPPVTAFPSNISKGQRTKKPASSGRSQLATTQVSPKVALAVSSSASPHRKTTSTQVPSVLATQRHGKRSDTRLPNSTTQASLARTTRVSSKLASAKTPLRTPNTQQSPPATQTQKSPAGNSASKVTSARRSARLSSTQATHRINTRIASNLASTQAPTVQTPRSTAVMAVPGLRRSTRLSNAATQVGNRVGSNLSSAQTQTTRRRRRKISKKPAATAPASVSNPQMHAPGTQNSLASSSSNHGASAPNPAQASSSQRLPTSHGTPKSPANPTPTLAQASSSQSLPTPHLSPASPTPNLAASGTVVNSDPVSPNVSPSVSLGGPDDSPSASPTPNLSGFVRGVTLTLYVNPSVSVGGPDDSTSNLAALGIDVPSDSPSQKLPTPHGTPNSPPKSPGNLDKIKRRAANLIEALVSQNCNELSSLKKIVDRILETLPNETDPVAVDFQDQDTIQLVAQLLHRLMKDLKYKNKGGDIVLYFEGMGNDQEKWNELRACKNYLHKHAG